MFAAMNYSPEWRAMDALMFTASYRYHEVTVKLLLAAENAAVVEDLHGNKRVIAWADMSFASEHIAHQNPKSWQVLKIRKWS
jgi:hypothetical protein